MIVRLVNGLAFLKEYLSDEKHDLRRPFGCVELHYNDDRLYLWSPPRGCTFLSTFISCLFLVLELWRAFHYLDWLAFCVSFWSSLLSSIFDLLRLNNDIFY